MRKSILVLSMTFGLFSFGAAPDAMGGSHGGDAAWVVAGVALGADFEKLFETFDKSKSMIEAKGYVAADNVETSKQLWFYESGEKDPAPDVISEYSFQIRDGQIYVEGEADGEKRITHLLYRDKTEGDADARRQTLVDRYGEPRTESAGMLEWGCETSSGPCLQADANAWQFEVRMRNAEAMAAWQSEYQKLLAAAKGESTESKF